MKPTHPPLSVAGMNQNGHAYKYTLLRRWLGSHYMVYRSHSHLSDLVKPYILSLDWRRQSLSRALGRTRWKSSMDRRSWWMRWELQRFSAWGIISHGRTVSMYEGWAICLPSIKDFPILASKSSISCLFLWSGLVSDVRVAFQTISGSHFTCFVASLLYTSGHHVTVLQRLLYMFFKTRRA